jgi:hypothetical protein
VSIRRRTLLIDTANAIESNYIEVNQESQTSGFESKYLLDETQNKI